MLSTRSVIAFLQQEDFLVSVDIKEAYLYVPAHPRCHHIGHKPMVVNRVHLYLFRSMTLIFPNLFEEDMEKGVLDRYSGDILSLNWVILLLLALGPKFPPSLSRSPHNEGTPFTLWIGETSVRSCASLDRDVLDLCVQAFISRGLQNCF